MVVDLTWSRTDTVFSASYEQVYIHISKDSQKETEKQRMGKIHILCVRSSHLEVFCKKGVLKNFAKFTGKQLCQSLFLLELVLATFYQIFIFHQMTALQKL